MLSTDTLKEFGANVDEGLKRCMGQESFYLKLVAMALEDDRLPHLKRQIEDGDRAAAFETAHALKGMYANLSLDPLTKPVSEITELLRSRTDTDYTGLISQALEQLERLKALQVL